MGEWKSTEERLNELVKNFTKPIPFYDSMDPDTRKQIGEVVEVYKEDGELKGIARLDDGKFIKSNL